MKLKKKIMIQLDETIKALEFADIKLDKLADMWYSAKFYPCIDTLTRCSGWNKYVSLRRALSNLKEIRKNDKMES